MRSYVRGASLSMLVGSVFLALACGSDPGVTGDSSEGPGDEPSDASRSCVDADGDGFGVDCKAGPDCDDADETVFDDCSACSRPDEGCPCFADAKPVLCKLDSALVPAGSILCEDGKRYCRDGAWTECMGVATFD
jgi:hypothetical protein